MKYQLMLRAQPTLTESISNKHRRFMTALAGIHSDWGLGGKKWPPVKKPGPNDEFFVALNFGDLFGKGIRGHVSYQIRKGVAFDLKEFGKKHADVASNDDWFSLAFNPEKVNYQHLVRDIFEKYIVAFEPYVGKIHDEEFTDLDFDRARKIDGREGVYRVMPVHYFGGQLCRRAFGKTPTEIVRLLERKVESAKLVCGGALIIASSRVLTMAEADVVHCEIKSLLTGKKVAPTEGIKGVAEPVKEPPSSKKKTGARKPLGATLARATILAMAYLELCDDNVIDPDTAVNGLEMMAAELRDCTPEEKRILKHALEELIAEEKMAENRPEALSFYEDTRDDLGLVDE